MIYPFKILLATFPKRILWFAVVFGLIRAVLSFSYNTIRIGFDEDRNFCIAQNHVDGKGYAINDVYNSYKYSTGPVLSAFHSSFPVFFYEFLIRHHIKKTTWIFVHNLLSVFMLIVSIFYFYKLCLYFLNPLYAQAATFVYCIFPPVIYYVGALSKFENFAMPFIIITCYYIIKSTKKNLSFYELLIMALSLLLSLWCRSQTLPVYMLLYSLFIAFLFIKKKWLHIGFCIALIGCAVLMHVPVLKKNKEMFGSYILSTQNGFELLQGNNPMARGAWRGGWFDSTTAYYKYSASVIPNIRTINEYQESEMRKEVAFKWMKENKLALIKLDLRKMALYFLPQNAEPLPYFAIYNPFNLIVYLLFLWMLAVKAVKRGYNFTDFVMLAPFAGSMALTIIYFMGARWRFYAEPFMIIYAVMAVKQLKESPFISKFLPATDAGA